MMPIWACDKQQDSIRFTALANRVNGDGLLAWHYECGRLPRRRFAATMEAARKPRILGPSRRHAA